MPRVRLNRPTIESCGLVLNAHELRVNGCLRPGWSGTWRIEERSDGKAKVIVRLRAEADRLHLSWDPPLWSYQSQDHPRLDNPSPDKPSEGDLSEDGEFDEITETVSLVHFSNHFGGGYTLFVCPGLQGANDVGAVDVANNDVANNDAAVRAVATSCGKRTVRLYLARLSGLPGRFLCRQCSRLVHITPYELPWQRARRRVNKLRRRLGVAPGVSTALVAPPKPRFITVDRYEYLLDKLLWAEIAVTEAQTAYFLQLAERIAARSRRAPKFTL
jgi:hypothetical protein